MSPALVAAFVCLVPATLVLWALSARFEGYFDEKRFVFSLVAGFFGGIVVAFLELQLFRFHDPLFLAAGAAPLLLALGYALLESLAKLVVLGSKGFRTRKDTPYYGASLGAGFGALLALQYLAADIRDVDAFDRGLEGARAVLPMALLAWGMVLTSSAVGVRLGKSVTDGRLRSAAFRAMLWQSPMPALLGFLLLARHYGLPGVQVTLVGLAGLVYGAVLVFVAFRTLDNIVPPEIRDLVRRDRRRQARAKARGADDVQEPAGDGTAR